MAITKPTTTHPTENTAFYIISNADIDTDFVSLTAAETRTISITTKQQQKQLQNVNNNINNNINNNRINSNSNDKNSPLLGPCVGRPVPMTRCCSCVCRMFQ